MLEQKISASSLMNERLLTYLYTQSNKTDREIAEFFNVDRTFVTKVRAEFGVDTRITTGYIGEQKAVKKLRSKGFRVKDMNSRDKLSPFDLLVNGRIKVEVKSAKNHGKRFSFSLSEQAIRNCKESDERIVLSTGRTKKLFSKTCDYFIFVCIGDVEDVYYIIPSHALEDDIPTINIRVGALKYERFRDNWELLRKG